MSTLSGGGSEVVCRRPVPVPRRSLPGSRSRRVWDLASSRRAGHPGWFGGCAAGAANAASSSGDPRRCSCRHLGNSHAHRVPDSWTRRSVRREIKQRRRAPCAGSKSWWRGTELNCRHHDFQRCEREPVAWGVCSRRTTRDARRPPERTPDVGRNVGSGGCIRLTVIGLSTPVLATTL